METATTTTTTTAPKATPKAKAAPRKAEKIALKSLCSQLRMEPKAARRKLRKAGLSFHGAKERWVFTSTQAERVREILKPSAKPKAEATPKAN